MGNITDRWRITATSIGGPVLAATFTVRASSLSGAVTAVEGIIMESSMTLEIQEVEKA